MSIYTYEKEVNLENLIIEIKSSSITIALNEDTTRTINDTVELDFKSALSFDEKDILDQVVADHDPTKPSEAIPDEVTLVGNNEVQALKPYSDDVYNYKILVPPVSNRTTWYQNSIRVEDEVAIDSGDHTTYNLSHNNIINIHSEDLTIRHDSIILKDGTFGTCELYHVNVKVNDELILFDEFVENTEYTIDYRAGSITFTTPLELTDEVKVSYNYENGSVFKLRPQPGYTFRMLRSRILTSIVSKNFISPVYFAVYAGDPSYTYYDYYFGKKPFCQFIFMYRSLQDLLIDSDDSQVISMSPYTYDILDLRLNYDRAMILDSAQFVEARIGILNDIEMSDFELFNLHISIEQAANS